MLPVDTYEQSMIPPQMTQPEIDRYAQAAKAAQKLAQENILQIQSLHREENMNIFETIRDRFSDSQTTITGIGSMVLPVLLGALGISHPHILLVNAAFGVVTAWLAKKDITSAAGLSGSFGAMALQAFGIPVPDWAIAGLNGFTGFLSRDQKLQ
jgi:hypothetical protein